MIVTHSILCVVVLCGVVLPYPTLPYPTLTQLTQPNPTQPNPTQPYLVLLSCPVHLMSPVGTCAATVSFPNSLCPQPTPFVFYSTISSSQRQQSKAGLASVMHGEEDGDQEGTIPLYLYLSTSPYLSLHLPLSLSLPLHLHLPLPFLSLSSPFPFSLHFLSLSLSLSLPALFNAFKIIRSDVCLSTDS